MQHWPIRDSIMADTWKESAGVAAQSASLPRLLGGSRDFLPCSTWVPATRIAAMKELALRVAPSLKVLFVLVVTEVTQLPA